MNKMFSKENLTTVGGLGIGATAAKVLEKKVINKVLPEQMAAYADVISGVAPIIAGFLLPTLVKGNLGQGIGHGMIAAGSAKLVEKALTTVGAGELITGTDTLMNGVDDMFETSGSFLGNVSDSTYYPQFSTDAAEATF
jgi:Flp pilus assembly pilin Flp